MTLMRQLVVWGEVGGPVVEGEGRRWGAVEELRRL